MAAGSATLLPKAAPLGSYPGSHGTAIPPLVFTQHGRDLQGNAEPQVEEGLPRGEGHTEEPSRA